MAALWYPEIFWTPHNGGERATSSDSGETFLSRRSRNFNHQYECPSDFLVSLLVEPRDHLRHFDSRNSSSLRDRVAARESCDSWRCRQVSKPGFLSWSAIVATDISDEKFSHFLHFFCVEFQPPPTFFQNENIRRRMGLLECVRNCFVRRPPNNGKQFLIGRKASGS